MNLLATLGGRYQLVRLIGQGAMGEVFETRDLELGATVALKRFREVSAENLLDLKREFRLLTGIYEPGLVRLYDLVVEGGMAFFTMELVDGIDVVSYARTAGIERAIAALGRISGAVAALHRHGYVHRDLKPANILVTREGDVRVLDFGLAGPLGRARGGTLAYMAPESILEGATTEASDWYAFGTVMYEALSGQLPVRGELAERLLRIRARRFPPLERIEPGIPKSIAELVWRLLDPDPRARADHKAIAEAIGEAPTAPSPVVGRALVGRVDELAWLSARLACALSGRAAAARIEGSSGVGKSSLMRAFLATTDARSCVILTSAARPQESVPLRAIDAIVDQIVDEVRRAPPGERTEMLADLPPSLVRSFPVFGAVDPRAGEPLVRADGAEARREAHNAFADLVARFASRKPVILWIDDMQWADHESLQLVERVATSHANARLLVLLVGRNEGGLVERNTWFAALDALTLAPLDDATSLALLNQLTRERPLSPDSAEHALVQARGNAFLLEFFARHADGVHDMTTALAAVLGRLEPDARALFDCIALAQHPMPLTCVGRVIADRAHVRGHVWRLSAVGLISIDATERITPYHDAIRELANTTLDSETLRTRHGSLAVALADSPLPPEWQIPHLEGAGRLDAACSVSLTAARAASSRYAFEIAAAYYAKALAFGDFTSVTRAPILEGLAGNLGASGRGREAAARYGEAAADYESHGSFELALVMKQRAAIALLRSGALDEGRTMLAAALRSLGERLPRAPVVASAIEALRVALAPRRRGYRELTAEQRMRLEMLWTTAVTLSMYDPLVANALTLRFVNRALRAGESPWTIRALSLEASFLAAVGGRYRALARRRVAELRERERDELGPYDVAWIAATEGSTSWLSGDVRRCLAWTTYARERFHHAPETNAHELALIEAFRLPALALVGEHAAALAGANDVIAVAEGRGDEFAMLPCLHGHVTLAYLAAGQLEVALRNADRALVIGRRGDSPMPAYHQVWSRAVLALYESDGVRAHRGLLEAWPRLRRLGMLRIEAVVGDLRYVRGRCALAARDLRDAAAQARWLRASTLGFAPPAADFIDAQLARLRGDDRVAAELAERAAASFDVIGLGPDRDAVLRWSRGDVLRLVDRIYASI